MAIHQRERRLAASAGCLPALIGAVLGLAGAAEGALAQSTAGVVIKPAQGSASLDGVVSIEQGGDSLVIRDRDGVRTVTLNGAAIEPKRLREVQQGDGLTRYEILGEDGQVDRVFNGPGVSVRVVTTAPGRVELRSGVGGGMGSGVGEGAIRWLNAEGAERSGEGAQAEGLDQPQPEPRARPGRAEEEVRRGVIAAQRAEIEAQRARLQAQLQAIEGQMRALEERHRALAQGMESMRGAAAPAQPPRAVMGIVLGELDEAQRALLGLGDRKAVLIDDVQEGRPAAGAGLQRFDVIVELDGQDGIDADRLRELLASKEPGDEVRVVVLRGGEKRVFEFELGASAPQPAAPPTPPIPPGFVLDQFAPWTQRLENDPFKELQLSAPLSPGLNLRGPGNVFSFSGPGVDLDKAEAMMGEARGEIVRRFGSMLRDAGLAEDRADRLAEGLGEMLRERIVEPALGMMKGSGSFSAGGRLGIRRGQGGEWHLFTPETQDQQRVIVRRGPGDSEKADGAERDFHERIEGRMERIERQLNEVLERLGRGREEERGRDR